MKKFIAATCIAGAISIALPGLAQAREVTLTTQLKRYSGNDAYLAIYLTDANGQYQKTLWVAGKKSKYYKHLSDWARGSKLNPSEFDGVSGASVGSGRTLKVSVELADTLIDAGYQIRIDSAVEDKRDVRADVSVPLTSEGAGKPAAGSTYVESFTYDL
ncbi:Tat pathway signal protein [Pseudomonas sp. E141]|uniref:DUF2271 domain-containing protein n=1 Tax=Pseudomonas sp. E141 TaxID=2875961 RepID=UPI0040458D44